MLLDYEQIVKGWVRELMTEDRDKSLIDYAVSRDELYALIRRVREDQKERDAKVCEGAMMLNDDTHEIWQHGFDTAKNALAAAIRQQVVG